MCQAWRQVELQEQSCIQASFHDCSISSDSSGDSRDDNGDDDNGDDDNGDDDNGDDDNGDDGSDFKIDPLSLLVNKDLSYLLSEKATLSEKLEQQTTPDKQPTPPDNEKQPTPPDDEKQPTPPDNNKRTTPPNNNKQTTPPDDDSFTMPPKKTTLAGMKSGKDDDAVESKDSVAASSTSDSKIADMTSPFRPKYLSPSMGKTLMPSATQLSGDTDETNSTQSSDESGHRKVGTSRNNPIISFSYLNDPKHSHDFDVIYAELKRRDWKRPGVVFRKHVHPMDENLWSCEMPSK